MPIAHFALKVGFSYYVHRYILVTEIRHVLCHAHDRKPFEWFYCFEHEQSKRFPRKRASLRGLFRLPCLPLLVQIGNSYRIILSPINLDSSISRKCEASALLGDIVGVLFKRESCSNQRVVAMQGRSDERWEVSSTFLLYFRACWFWKVFEVSNLLFT